jgi:hypothetical protein
MFPFGTLSFQYVNELFFYSLLHYLCCKAGANIELFFRSHQTFFKKFSSFFLTKN